MRESRWPEEINAAAPGTPVFILHLYRRMTTGKTVGGMPLHGDENLLAREEALRPWTRGSAWWCDGRR